MLCTRRSVGSTFSQISYYSTFFVSFSGAWKGGEETNLTMLSPDMFCQLLLLWKRGRLDLKDKKSLLKHVYLIRPLMRPALTRNPTSSVWFLFSFNLHHHSRWALLNVQDTFQWTVVFFFPLLSSIRVRLSSAESKRSPLCSVTRPYPWRGGKVGFRCDCLLTGSSIPTEELLWGINHNRYSRQRRNRNLSAFLYTGYFFFFF